jgi:hypothetical protein
MRFSQFLSSLTHSFPARLVLLVAICLGTIGAGRLLGVDRIADIDSASEQVGHR